MTGVAAVRRMLLIRPGGMGDAVRVARLAGLVALLWAVTGEQHADNSPRVPVGLLVAAAVAWVGWLVCLQVTAPVRMTWLALAVLAGVGAAVGALAPVGIAFPAVAVIATATLAGVAAMLVVAAVAAAALTATVVAAGSPHAILVEGLLAIAAALLGGATRRQAQDRAAQAELLLAERARADTEQARAAALAERNRIAGEIHDVLAHSLGALSVHLEAADALLETAADPAQVQASVRQARSLAVSGLGEARRAVHALRDEPGALGEQLATLAAADGAALRVTGLEPLLAADVRHAVYRAAQEALTNARKHAPGAPVRLWLDFGATATVLVVENGPCPAGRGPSPLGQTGGGVGLPAMRDRIERLGGQLTAAGQDGGWTVRASVPR